MATTGESPVAGTTTGTIPGNPSMAVKTTSQHRSHLRVEAQPQQQPSAPSPSPSISLTFLPSPNPRQLPVHFVLSDCPQPERLAKYAQAYVANRVCHVFRVCDPSMYDARQLELLAGGSLQVHDDIKFADGGVPEPSQVFAFLRLFQSILATTSANTTTTTTTDPLVLPAIAIHCVSGLGRAPVLLLIAILEYCEKMELLDTVDYVRKYRRGALNRVQLQWLEQDFDRKLRRKEWKKRKAVKPGDLALSSFSSSGEPKGEGETHREGKREGKPGSADSAGSWFQRMRKRFSSKATSNSGINKKKESLQ